MADNNLHKDHRKRVREKVLENGFDCLAEHELLEKLLFHVIPRGDTNGLAHVLIQEFGSLKGVLNADFHRLAAVKGVGDKTALYLCTLGETVHRVSRPEKPSAKKSYKDKNALYDLVLSVVGGKNVEEVYLFCFDESWRYKRHFLISQGDEFTSEINLRKIVESAVFSRANMIVLAHNHPLSGSEPSVADIESTRYISVNLRKLGIVLADHIIVGEDFTVYSMHSDAAFSSLFF